MKATIRTTTEGFEQWLATTQGPIAVDTETTGLDIFSPGFAVRTVQFGDRDTAYVLRVDRDRAAIRAGLASEHTFVLHNAPFDLLSLDKMGLVTLESAEGRVFDTRTMAHLLDPRTEAEGGIGHGLKKLAQTWVDPNASDGQAELQAEFRMNGWKKDEGWAKIALDNPVYTHYAGMDVILTRRLFDELKPMILGMGAQHLLKFELHLMQLLCRMQRKGMRLDVPYTQSLHNRLQIEAVEYAAAAQEYGVENIGSGKQVAEALLTMGETLTEQTPSGAWKVDRAVLLPMADLDQQWTRLGLREPNPLADAVVRAKRADKWSVAYTGAFLDLKDSQDRLHPWINSLQARTARMSVSRPPLQQLPSGDWTIRRAFIADPGQVIIAADYSQIEMRVLAALSGDSAMIEAITSGVDLHDYTAEKLFGPNFTKTQRKLAKGVGFGKVYGGGAETLSRQTGAGIGDVRRAIQAYDEVFKGIKRYSRGLMEKAEYGKREVVTRTGRHLPLDRDRLYAATNYVVQSTARDVMAQAIVDLYDAGLGDHLLLPIHDEVIGQAPKAEAEDVVQEIRKVMERDFDGIPLTSDAEVYGETWANGYGYVEGNDANE